MCTKNDIDKLNLEKDYEIFSYNELTKNYTQDRKTIDIILNKFKDLNLNIMMVIENNKFIDSLILFEKAKLFVSNFCSFGIFYDNYYFVFLLEKD